jgi:hypothetical protein
LDRNPRSSLEPASPRIIVERVAYHGWSDCYRISNGLVVVVVVPAIGRVMQFGLEGASEGVFWENRALDGQLHEAAANEWVNFGGDKCWPAPQAVWTGQQGRDWPPPEGFDARPVQAAVVERGVVVSSPIDPGFGIQVVRHVELDRGQPVLRIRSEYRKQRGRAVRVGIWSITQLREPERVGLLLPEKSRFAGGYTRLLEAEPADLKIAGRVLSLGRHTRQYVKVGTDGNSLVWVGRACALRIDAESGTGEYPDGGCVTEVYTNPDPLKYVELETLGPLTTLHTGQRMERTTVYTLKARSRGDADAEARELFG